MYNHAPKNYVSPLKRLIDRVDLDLVLSNEVDIFYQDDDMTALVSAITEPRNQGSTLIIPNQVYENIYDMPDELLAKIHVFSKKVAVALKEVYGCDGVSVRQHNEPAGDQEVWHYHLHVVPRFAEDDFYPSYPTREVCNPKERAEYAKKLGDYFNNNK